VRCSIDFSMWPLAILSRRSGRPCWHQWMSISMSF
jgi:hypothetical protein